MGLSPDGRDDEAFHLVQMGTHRAAFGGVEPRYLHRQGREPLLNLRQLVAALRELRVHFVDGRGRWRSLMLAPMVSRGR